MIAPESAWKFEHHVGAAAPFHGREVDDPAIRSVWWFEVSTPALVLGSTQDLNVVDHEAAAVAGIEVARRRSGGGAVWLAPGLVTWVDVVVPATDSLWDDDIGRSAHWLGEVWVEVLGGLGLAGARVHRGPMVTTPWSGLICFAGLGPGEVMVDSHKVVGVSQRRTRSGARFQCAVLHGWDPGPMLAVLDLTDDDRVLAERVLAPVARGVGLVDSRVVVEAFLAVLARL